MEPSNGKHVVIIANIQTLKRLENGKGGSYTNWKLTIIEIQVTDFIYISVSQFNSSRIIIMSAQQRLTSDNLTLHNKLTKSIKEQSEQLKREQDESKTLQQQIFEQSSKFLENVSDAVADYENSKINSDTCNDEEDEEEEEDDDDDNSDYTFKTDLLRDPQKEWEENLAQLNTLLNFVLLPIVGKVLGRRFANIVWRKIAEHIF